MSNLRDELAEHNRRYEDYVAPYPWQRGYQFVGCTCGWRGGDFYQHLAELMQEYAAKQLEEAADSQEFWVLPSQRLYLRTRAAALRAPAEEEYVAEPKPEQVTHIGGRPLR